MQDVRDIKRDDTPVTLYNPLSKEFTTKWRNDSNVEQTLSIPPYEVNTFPAHQAVHVKKNLIDRIINERNLGFVNPEERAVLEKEVEYDLRRS